MLLYLNPPALIEEGTLRVSEHVRVIQARLRAGQRSRVQGNGGKSNVVSMPKAHRSLQAKAQDRKPAFEREYPW
jgi:hypothetical protein